MTRDQVFRLSLVLTLSCAFISIVILALNKLMNEDTIFITREMEGQSRFPTFTICPSKLNWSVGVTNAQNMTFQDLKELMNQSQQYLHASLMINGLQVDLMDKYLLKKHFNVTFEEVWSFGLRMDHTPPFLLSMCALINPPIEQVSSDNIVLLTINIKDGGIEKNFFLINVARFARFRI